MAMQPTWPGVYVQEVPSGVRTIAAVSTSVALFVGFTRSGPVNTPVLCPTYSDYVRVFGDDVTAGDMTRQVKLFFLNGGSQCYVQRVAEGYASSEVTLRAADGATPVLTLRAAFPGVSGDLIRAQVTYDGAQPEDTFNLEVFRWEPMPNGTLVPKGAETWRGLSMDPESGAFAPLVLNANSKLITATSPVVASDAQGASSTALLTLTAGAEFTEIIPAFVVGASIQVSFNRSRFVNVPLPTPAAGNDATYPADILAAITTAFTTAALPAPAGLSAIYHPGSAGNTSWLRLESAAGQGNVFVRRGTSVDGATALRFGSEQGGIEVTQFAHLRPAPTGVVSDVDFDFFEELIDAASGPGAAVITLNKYDATGVLTPATVNATWSSTNLREILSALRQAIVSGPPPALVAALGVLGPGEVWPWSAELWGHRLAIVPTNGPGAAGTDDNRVSAFNYAGDAAATLSVVDNVRRYSLGATGTGSFQTGGIPGVDGTAPTSGTTYDNAYVVARRDIDLFNLLVLPRSASNAAIALEDLWANASVFCEQERAFLLMESPPGWRGAQVPANGVTALRVGLSKQYAALYHPRITVQEGRARIDVGATGAMAGLMGRIDSARGVWKAPAGTEADLRGIVGVAELFSDVENGVMNPRAINAVRSFPNGIVSWGARTMDGDDGFASEYKYVPIRRLALFIEESLFRGLKWVVFEPNDEPLWAQIRLNVGAFMQGMFRQGAFQGTRRQDAYYVKCDAETTTQNDRNLGIVNIWVGFAPLKPAEFVMLSLQQMAGQIEV